VTEQLTRRAMREAERGGAPAALPAEVAAPIAEVTPQRPVSSPDAPLTRRQLRELGLMAQSPTDSGEPPAALKRDATPGSRRQLRNAVEPIEAPEIEVPEPDFTGNNLLAEPSTESIILDRAPEAIELPISTGEITVTGSIQVITDSMNEVATSSTDAIDLDEDLAEDAVTGVLSVVEPISALELIGERAHTGVVPNSAMNKGRWKPFAFGLGSVILAGATIWATITIIGAAG